MKQLIDVIVLAAELLEAEAQKLRVSLSRLLTVALVGMLLLVLALAGLGFLLAGVFILIAHALSPAASALIIGGCAVAITAIGLSIIAGIIKNPPAMTVEEGKVAQAKIRLRQAADQIDPLAPLRHHPLRTVGLSGATGALLGAATQELAPAVMLIRSVAATISSLSAAFKKNKPAEHNGAEDPGPARKN